jgi:hypothetical protein
MDDFQEVADRLNREYPDPKEFMHQLFLAFAKHTQLVGPPAPPPPPPTIHYTELPKSTPSMALAVEWDFYRREVGRLLAEGHEGEWVLIKGEQIIGFWATDEEARAVLSERFPGQPAMIHHVLTREPLLRGPKWYLRCPS